MPYVEYGTQNPEAVILLHEMIPDSTTKSLPNLCHGDLSPNCPEQYASMLLQMVL